MYPVFTMVTALKKGFLRFTKALFELIICVTFRLLDWPTIIPCVKNTIVQIFMFLILYICILYLLTLLFLIFLCFKYLLLFILTVFVRVQLLTIATYYDSK